MSSIVLKEGELRPHVSKKQLACRIAAFVARAGKSALLRRFNGAESLRPSGIISLVFNGLGAVVASAARSSGVCASSGRGARRDVQEVERFAPERLSVENSAG
ncbi:MAG: hypothetical protein AAGA81_02275 [Acidobacteriota bacterium]